MAASTTTANQAELDWDNVMWRGKQHALAGQWEMALQAYTTAMSLCHDSSQLQSDTTRRHRVLKDMAYANRCMGRYERSLQLLDEILQQLSTSDPLRLKIMGELGVLYLRLERVIEARDAFQEQYNLAAQLNDRQRMCRAVGNLGVANHHLSQREHGHELLNQAVKQLQERIRLAQDLRDGIVADPAMTSRYDYYTILKAVGLSRLSICYGARGEDERAVATALEAVQLETEERPFVDSSVEAMSRFFYGRALYRAGHHREALKQFDLPKKCSPAVAFCKEPSRENCDYLRELFDVGAEMDTPDEHSYHSLDYAVFNGNKTAQAIVLKFLERKISSTFPAEDVSKQLDKRFEEARLRRHYREVFQDQMRPVLMVRKDDCLHQIRQTYAIAIDKDVDLAKSFDRLKFVKYEDFKAFNRFPRSSEDLTNVFDATANTAAAQHIVFISYRWVNRDPWARYPDDAENRQYHRIIRAVEEYLKLHPAISIGDLGIWIDFACIDQDCPLPGISALPLIIAQCDALISLVDEQYHQRAWCSVEVMMIKALREKYNLHAWYEHVEDGEGPGVLRAGPVDLKADPGEKTLAFEIDREKVLFLERQCRLLC